MARLFRLPLQQRLRLLPPQCLFPRPRLHQRLRLRLSQHQVPKPLPLLFPSQRQPRLPSHLWPPR